MSQNSYHWWDVLVLAMMPEKLQEGCKIEKTGLCFKVPIYWQIQLRGRRPWSLGLLQALTFLGKKSLNILWNPGLIPGDECFAFETQASALWSPTEKGVRRVVVKPIRATSLTQSLALGRHSGAQTRGHPPPAFSRGLD